MKNNISEINKDSFWSLIDQAREQCGQDQDAFYQWLQDCLMALGPEQAMIFDSFVHGYRDAAYKYGLWIAADIICDGCTDDGFMDFRGWLISQGRDVYMAALKDPDSLADIPTQGRCYLEDLSYVGDYAYEKLTGRDSFECFDPVAYLALAAELEKDIVYGEGIEYPYDWGDIPAYLPKLCAKYMKPEELARLVEMRADNWNQTSLSIQKARSSFRKSKKVVG